MGYEKRMGQSPALEGLYEAEMAAYRSLVESDVIARLASALAMARKKHPTYADGATAAWDVIEEELMELYHAIDDHESEERQKAEAIDVAVTAIRFILGEHKDVDKVGESG